MNLKSRDLESEEYQIFVNACLIKFKNSQFFLSKINHRFLLTTKLYTG